ncbi:MAG: endonuclease/exonuclease/phosphatase family protein [Opitutales bacterium]
MCAARQGFVGFPGGLLLLLLCCCVSMLEARADTLRVATYNVKNYLVMDRMVAGQWKPEYPKPEAEKKIIRQVILECSPDILVLQEIGGSGFLEELQRDLKQGGLDYAHAVLMRGVDETRHVAVLSHLKPREVKQHRDLDFKYFDTRLTVKRGLLEVGFELPGGEPFQLFAVHLKSRWSDEPRDPESQMRRTREAQACRDRIIERTLESGRAAYVVAGDFNDHPASAPLRRFYQRGDLELGSLLPAADRRGHVWTHYYQKHAAYTLVDGFVVSPAFLARIKGGEGHIADRPGVLSGSDHRMVYFDLKRPVAAGVKK